MPRSVLVPLISAVSFSLGYPASSEVLIEWVTVGDPGNSCETQSAGCFGSVADYYRIGKYEVTNAQYSEFLNAVAVTDTNLLYSTDMGSGFGGITQSGSPGSYSYSAIAGREDMPVNFVSFWEAARFANWLHNGQPTGAQDNASTEDGAYTLTPTGIANNTVTRNGGAAIFVTSEDEWYKAAYYKGGGPSAGYWDYPAGSNTQPSCTAPGATANTGNCLPNVDLTDVGSYTGSASPFGTFDQGGNILEWNEEITMNGFARAQRGGAFAGDAFFFAASVREGFLAALRHFAVGFRVARTAPPPPEPEPVPSLSPFGMAALFSLLAAVAYRGLRSGLRRGLRS